MKPNEAPISQYVYFQRTGDEFSTVESDVYYEENGKRYKRFYKGQEIPKDVWEAHFGKASATKEAVAESQPVEQVEEEPQPVPVESEVVEPKARKAKTKK